MKNSRSAPKRFLFCLKEMRRRAGKYPLVLLWDMEMMDWRVMPPDHVQVMGFQQDEIVHKNF